MQTTRYDPLYAEQYPALNVMNNSDLADRCREKNAPKVIHAYKATARENNDMAISLRAGFQNGYINLLINENEAEEKVSKIRGYQKLNDTEKTKLILPYVHTTMLVNELINLTHDTSSGLVKVKERSGMRKDRFSSCEYGWSLIQDLNKNLRPQTNVDDLLRKLVGQIHKSSLLRRS